MTRISIFGIGYVGAVSAACLANDGHSVVAVDTQQSRVDCINAGRSPIVESGLDDLIANAVAAGRLRATRDVADAVESSDVSIVCVGTPSAPSGAIGTGYIETACREIGATLRTKSGFHSVVIRSTLVPGTMEGLCIPVLAEASGKVPGADFGIGYYPEFLRESTAIRDYYDPGLIVFGALDAPTETTLRELNSRMPVPCHVVPLATAEAVKYANNCWRAVKVTFANEIGNIAKACGIDGQTVMSLVCQDTKVNISPAFMRPGFAFGGSCLPKDLRALQHLAGERGVPSPLLSAVLVANAQQIDKAERMIDSRKATTIGLVGVSFKPGTDDLRESPLAEIAKRFVNKGCEIRIYDPNVRAARRSSADGSHKTEEFIPRLSERIVDSIDELIGASDLIVVGNYYEETVRQLGEAAHSVPVIDLARIDRKLTTGGHYEGICW